jgi:quercetin dioxygenase-like cupin family protein
MALFAMQIMDLRKSLNERMTGYPMSAVRRLTQRKSEDQTMNRIAFLASLALGATVAFTDAEAGTGTAKSLITKELPDVPGKEGMIELVDFAPGEASEIHRHNADLFVYVLEGTVVTQLEGEAPKTLTAGQVFSESPTDIHVISRNASATKPAKLLVFFVKAKGAPPTVLVPHDHK